MTPFGGGARPWAAAYGRQLLFALLVLASPLLNTASATDNDVELGRRIYEQGILPDGSPLSAMHSEGGVLFVSKSAACINCHRRSGLGSVEGSEATTVLVPPVAGPLLFRAARFHGKSFDRSRHWIPNEAWARSLTRSAYNEQTLARALREGIDADGNRLMIPMPRYALDEQSVSVLTAYLKQLASQAAPGVEADSLHLATVITPDVSAEQADAMLGVVRAWSAHARGVAKHWKLHVWQLSGPAERWHEQLQAYYRQQPVFALLSGAGGAHWSPVHRFCEENRLPCVLPSLELAPENEGGYYPIYYSPGVSLEARLLAAHLAASRAPSPVVQLFSDDTGEQAAQQVRSHWTAADAQLMERRYDGRPEEALAHLPRDGTLMLWLRPAQIQQLVAAAPQGPAVQQVFISALLAPPEALDLPPEWKARVVWISLFDDVGVQAQIARARLQRWLKQQGLPDRGTLRVQADAYAACYLFTSALSALSSEEWRRPAVPLNRDHLIEALENIVNKYSDGSRRVDSESHVAYYGRMSLGPGQRVAVRGGGLLRYASPDSTRLELASERIVP
ncbi:MAG TPA: hypothetical protein VGE50_13220 [Gammaproteobacteria bacterium]